MRLKRQNIIWLSFILGMTALAFLGGAVELAAGLMLIALAAVAVGVAVMPRPDKIIETIQQQSARPAKGVSPQAHDAVGRAVQRGGRMGSDLQLMDIGLIATAMSDEGMVMRRTDEISKDDQGARPFVVLKVSPSAADRRGRLRFEMMDHTGSEQYIHEMDVFLRDGEMNILADHHLPLENNSRIEGMGQWDLRVFLDGELMAMHGFTLTPSYEERANRLGTARRTYVMSDDRSSDREADRGSVQGESMRLEDLLRQQSQRRSDR
jgi:hypothetical protein